MTVAEYSRRWLVQVAATRNRRTFESYRWALGHYLIPRLGITDMAEVTRTSIKECMVAIRATLAGSTVRVVLTTLSAMLSDAVEDELITANPSFGISRRLRLGASPGRIKSMTAEQLHAFLAASEGRYSMLWYIMAHTGLRIGEAIQLRPGDVDLEAGVMRIRAETSKGRIGRVVELGCGLVARLRSYMGTLPAGARYLLLSPRGCRLRAHRARAAFKAQIKELGFSPDLTPHSLRHTYASLLVAAGAPLEWLRRQLGHSSIKVTVDLYGRHAPMSGREWLDKVEKT